MSTRFKLLLAASLTFTLSHLSALQCGNANSTGPSGNDDEPTTPEPIPCPAAETGGPNYFIASTGNVLRKVDDIEVWGGVGNHQLRFTRHGVSRYGGFKHHFGWGHHWSHSYNWRLVTAGVDGAGNPIYEIQMPKGSIVRYYRVGSEPIWSSAADLADVLEQTQSGQLVYRNVDAWRYEFNQYTNSSGGTFFRLDRFFDPSGNIYTLSYSGPTSDEVLRVIEPGGRSLDLSYSWVSFIGKQATTLATVTIAPPAEEWTVLPITNTASFRYLIYRDPGQNRCRVAEIQFLDENDQPIPGQTLGTGPGSHPDRGPEKAFDGDPSTYFEFHNNAFGFLALDAGENNSHVVKKVRFRPAPGFASSMVNCRFEGTNLVPTGWSNRVITKVIANDNRPETTDREVTYQYGNLQDPILGDSYVVLTGVTYGDGSTAAYTYQQTIEGTQPLLATASDPRYVGQAQRMRYEFHTINAGPIGLIYREKNLVTGTMLATMEQQGANTVLVTYGNGAVETYGYSPTNRNLVVSRMNALGHTRTFNYSDNQTGLLTSFSQPTGGSTVVTARSPLGNPLVLSEPLGLEKSWTRDALDRPLTETHTANGVSRITTFERDSYGRITKHTHPDGSFIILPSGRKTTFTHDLAWRKTSRTVGAGSTEAATESYAYDGNGNVILITDPMGQEWEREYDLRNRLVAEIDPLGNRTEMTYNGFGNQLTLLDALQRLTSHSYDSMDRLLSTTNPNNETTSYTYDGGDNMLSLTDAKGNSYTFEYDLNNRRTKFVYPGGSFESWAFDDDAGAGQIWTTYTARDGSTMSCTFDNRGREIFCDYSATDTPDVTYSYDLVGRRLSASSSVSSHSYAYDVANQLLSETTTHAGLGTPFTVSYTYDADGNKSSLTYPDGTVVSFSHTARNQLKQVIADGPPPLATYAYNLNGQRTTKTLENGTVAAYLYDNANRLTQVAHSNSSGMFTQFDYTLNAVGNRTGMTRSGALAAVDTYQFDSTDQITQASYASGARTESFNYDPVGNRITSSDSAVGTTNYTANPLNQYTVVGAFVPTYDTRGNLTAKSPVKTYAYDSKNRLVAATNGANTATFAQDYRNRQMRRTINGNTIYFVYDDWNLIAEYNATGALDQKYVHGDVIDEILAKIDPSGTAYYHQDGLGSVVALTDSVGSLSESYRYDVFGTPSIFDASGTCIATSASGNRFLFTDREWIAELELYDYRNRCYSNSLGRFLQADPIRFDARDVNLYRYVVNHPTNSIDPLGLAEGNQGPFGPGLLCTSGKCKKPCPGKILPETPWKSSADYQAGPAPGDCKQADAYGEAGNVPTKIPNGWTCIIECGQDGEPTGKISCSNRSGFPFLPKPNPAPNFPIPD